MAATSHERTSNSVVAHAHLLRPHAPAMHRSNMRTGLMRRTEGSLVAPPGFYAYVRRWRGGWREILDPLGEERRPSILTCGDDRVQTNDVFIIADVEDSLGKGGPLEVMTCVANYSAIRIAFGFYNCAFVSDEVVWADKDVALKDSGSAVVSASYATRVGWSTRIPPDVVQLSLRPAGAYDVWDTITRGQVACFTGTTYHRGLYALPGVGRTLAHGAKVGRIADDRVVTTAIRNQVARSLIA